MVICAGDVAVAQSGAGANQEGKVHLCIGTATWVGISTSTFRNDPQKPFWGLNHIDPNKYIIAGEMETGGGALMWFRDVLCQEERRQASDAGKSSYDLLTEYGWVDPARVGQADLPALAFRRARPGAGSLCPRRVYWSDHEPYQGSYDPRCHGRRGLSPPLDLRGDGKDRFYHRRIQRHRGRMQQSRSGCRSSRMSPGDRSAW